MKIDYLKINGFGKIENKEILFNKNINLIYGKNEAGKTTLLKCILAMFYGLSKNKKGKEISDFDRYKPWKNIDFSGKLRYQLDSGEIIEVFRDFSKKNPKIFNEHSEDISKNFNIDKNRGNEFFYEQTKIDEAMLLATAFIEQKSVILDGKDKTFLTQKMANLLSTGEDNISYKKSMEKLNKDLIEQIGTERTIGRPINIVMEKIQKINTQKKELECKEKKKVEIKEEKEEIYKEIKLKEKQLILLKKIKEIKNKEILEKEKIKIKKVIVLDYEQKIQKLKEKKERKNRKKIIPICIALILSILNISLFIIYKFIGIIALLISFTIFLITYMIHRKKILEKDKLNKKEIKILEQNREGIENEIKTEEKLLENTMKAYKNELLCTFNAKEIEDFLGKAIEDLDKDIAVLEEVLGTLRIELNTIEIEEKNIIKDLEYKAELEEEFEKAEEEKQELQTAEKRIKLAQEVLERAYIKMKNQITPKFTEKLSNIASRISNNKYKNIKFNDTEGVLVELENGEYVNSNRLSVGTIEQLYLSLRLSAFEEIIEERIPIILDETFAYYDEERLENILEYLNNNFKENQIIIFTCTEREKNICEKLNIKYNFIEI